MVDERCICFDATDPSGDSIRTQSGWTDDASLAVAGVYNEVSSITRSSRQGVA